MKWNLSLILYKILTLNNASTFLSSNYYLGTLNLKLIDWMEVLLENLSAS
jgi:hypothetical protein